MKQLSLFATDERTIREMIAESVYGSLYRKEVSLFYPDLLDIKHWCTVGSYSVRSAPAVWIDRGGVVWVDDYPATAGQLARLYVKHGVKLHPVSKFEWNMALKEESYAPPKMARPGKYQDAVHVDLKSAYWQFVARLGYNVRYKPGSYLSVDMDLPLYPWGDDKLGRSMLVTVARNMTANYWTGEKLVSMPAYNPLRWPMLPAVVNHILHGVAAEIKEYAYHINVDGAIIPARMLDRYEETLHRWQLDYTIKGMGNATVWAVGNYRIGRQYTRHKIRAVSEHDNILSGEFLETLRKWYTVTPKRW